MAAADPAGRRRPAVRGGQLFAEASRREFVAVTESSVAAWETADEAVTDLAAAIVTEDGPRLSFVYLGAVDIAGHITGTGAVYRAAAQAADRRVGRLGAAVRGRPADEQQNWTVVVVTDHGHLDQGGRQSEVTTAWAAAAGPGIGPGIPPRITRQEQVAPLVLAALGRSLGQG
jgi:Type I phosphodiesterase / nucleotide pyrophosphatase